MQNSKIIRVIVCILVLAAVPQSSYAQVGKAAGSVAKTVSKKVGEKGAKSVAKTAGKNVSKAAGKAAAEEISEAAVRQAAEEIAEKAVKRQMGDIVEVAGERVLREDLEHLSREGAESALRHTVDKGIAKAAEKRVIKDGVEHVAGKTAGRELGEAGAKKYGTKTSAELAEKKSREVLGDVGAQKASKAASAKAARTVAGKEALELLDDVPDLKKLVSELENLKGPLFNIDNLRVSKIGGRTRLEFPGTKSIIEIEGDIIHANGGSVTRILPDGRRIVEGQNNEFLTKLLPNRRYMLEDDLITYTTANVNGVPRVVKVETKSSELYARMQRMGLARNGKFDEGIKKDLLDSFGVSNSDFDYSHLVRRELGGINESINAVPMTHASQGSGSKWFDIESEEIRRCKELLDSPGSSQGAVSSVIEIKYAPDGKSMKLDVKKMQGGKVYEKATFKEVFVPKAKKTF